MSYMWMALSQEVVARCKLLFEKAHDDTAFLWSLVHE